MLSMMLSNKYIATIVVVFIVMGYSYILKPASLFDEKGELKSKLLTPELAAIALGLLTYFIVDWATRARPQEVVVVGAAPSSQAGSSGDAMLASANNIRRADALMTTPFARRK